MARRSYTPEQKAEALAMYVDLGAGETARRTGIAKGTLCSWAGRNGVQSDAAAKMKIATEAARQLTESRKETVLHRLWQIAEKATAREMELIDDDKTPLRDLVGARTRAIHDAQLIDGGPTSRFDVNQREQVRSNADGAALRLVS